jgi:hypothetical protein
MVATKSTKSSSGQEGSVAFSLLELGRLEEERVRQEREAASARAREQEEARREVERRARAEDETREREEAEALRAEQRREREEAARAEAMRAAIVEKARLEAELHARSKDRELEHRHDVERREAACSRREKRLARLSVAQGLALVAVLAGAAVGYEAGIAPRTERRLAGLEGQVVERDQAIVSLRDQLASQRDALAAARKDAAAANDRAASLGADLDRARQELDKVHKSPAPHSPPAPHPGPVTGFSTHCDPNSGDPLCASLGH